jgi:homoserine dehydrogenase
MLGENADAIRRKIGRAVEVVAVGVRDAGKPRGISGAPLTTDVEAIVDDSQVEVVLELIGGLDPALSLVERALAGGKHVVTANKELIAKHGARLTRIATDRGVELHFEAAVGGGIPLVQPLRHQLAGNDVLRLIGILNGTTNVILTRMADQGASFEEALEEAQALGYAEADPASDVDGTDAAYKISILGGIAFGRWPDVDQIFREGIRAVQREDIRFADILGYRIKLLAIAEPHGDRAIIRVHPALVRKDHPLASVSGVYNALWVHGDFVGDVMFSGRGAGSEPTASAVVGDLIDIGRGTAGGGFGSVEPIEDGLDVLPIEEIRTSYYVRLIVPDRPRVLGAIATAFGEQEVSLSAMEMRVYDQAAELGEIVLMTHACKEAHFRAAVDSLVPSGCVVRVCNWLRVES